MSSGQANLACGRTFAGSLAIHNTVIHVVADTPGGTIVWFRKVPSSAAPSGESRCAIFVQEFSLELNADAAKSLESAPAKQVFRSISSRCAARRKRSQVQPISTRRCVPQLRALRRGAGPSLKPDESPFRRSFRLR